MTVVYMRTVKGKPLHRALTKPLPCKMFEGMDGFVPVDFESDGSSVPEVFRGLFPRHRHPVAFFRHDYRCSLAKNFAQRKWADQQFEADVGSTSWWITKKIGYLGVRFGALLGVGNRFQ